MDSQALDVRAAAIRLGCCEKTVRRMVNAGTLPHFRVGRLIRLRADALDRYMGGDGQQ
jgi:excisionase family DNA binding protein